MTISTAKTAAAISVILIHFFRVRSVCGQCGIREILRSRLVSYRFHFRFTRSSAKPPILRPGVRKPTRTLSESCQHVVGPLSESRQPPVACFRAASGPPPEIRPCGWRLRSGISLPCDPSACYLLEQMPEILSRRGHVDGEAQRLRGVNVLPAVVDEERFGGDHAASEGFSSCSSYERYILSK